MLRFRIIAFGLLLLPSLIIAQQKNVLLIAVDDLNDWIGVLGGNEQTITPNLDAFAEKAVVFANASCASPVCNPSRTAFLSGRRPHEIGLVNNDGARNFRDDPQQWVRELITIPEYFSSNGYESVGQGKIFHSHNSNPESWDILGPGGQGASGGIDDEVAGINWGYSANETLQQTGDWKSADYGVKYLSQNHNKPFFLAIGLFRPHMPLKAPKEFFDKFNLADINIPDGYLANDLDDTGGGSNLKLKDVQAADKWKEIIRAYLACVAFADANVGHLLQGLENSQYAENTVVVLIGDHGWHLGEKEHFQKFTLWDRAIKTPMFIYDPSINKSGKVFGAVSLQDIYPTLISLTNLPTPQFPLRGRDLSLLLNDPDGEWCGAALNSYTRGHSLRSNRYRYTRNNGTQELYDHELDPWEWINQAKNPEYATVLNEMSNAMDKMLDTNNEFPFENCELVDWSSEKGGSDGEDDTENTDEGEILNLNTESEGSLKVVPNPTKDWIKIINGQKMNNEYSIFDFSGRLVYEFEGDLLDTSKFKKGTYLIQNQENETGKFIKL